MKNQYLIKGKKAVIFVDLPPDYNIGGYVEVYIDKADLELIQSFPGSWYGFRSKHNDKLYVRGTKQSKVPHGFTSKQPLLHRAIANPTRGENTAFKDGDSLNCCRTNLVNLPIGQTYAPSKLDNIKLRVVRGVHWRDDKKCFEAKAYHNKKGYYLGLYAMEDWEAANTAVETFRRIGPDEYFKKYRKGATDFESDGNS